MKHVKTVSLTLALMFLVAGYVLAEGDAAKSKPQTTCPVLGGKIDKDVYVDHQGKRIYLCCKGCIDTFKKDPAKYLKKLEDEGVSLEDTPSGGHKEGSHNSGNDKHKTHGGCSGGCS